LATTLKLKRLAISAFLLVHMAAVVLWNLPGGEVRRRLDFWTPFYILPLGLGQVWDMFAPEPMKPTMELEAVVDDNRGISHTFGFLHMVDVPPWRRFLHVRDSKLTAGLLHASMKQHRMMLARHVVRSLDLAESDFPLTLELRYQVRMPPPIGAEAEAPPPPSVHVLARYRFEDPREAQPW
jgi:hypothetical protein